MFDGAFGTWVQGQDLGPDDFGGAALEGCNENLVLTRPDLIAADARASTSRSASTRSRPPPSARSPLVLGEYGIADETFEINEQAAPHRQGGRGRVLHARPAPLRDRLDRPRHQAPVARPDRASPSCATTTRRRSTACSPAASTCCSSRRSTTCSRPRPRSSAPGGRWPTAGRDGPAHGAGHGRDHGPHARRHRDRRRAHRARGDAARRHRPELRDRSGRDDRAPALPRAARAHVPVVPARTRGCRRSSTGTRTTTSRPTRSPTRTSASSTEFGLNIVGGCCGTTPEHLRAVVERIGTTARRSPRTPEFEPGCSSIYTPRAVPPGARVPRHRRAHQRQRLEEVPRRDARRRLGHLRADGARAGEGRRARARRVRRLRRPRRHRRHGRDREPLRHAGGAAARVRLHRAAGARGRAPALTAARRSSTRPTSRRARPRASASTACSRSPASTAPRSSASRIDEEGQARTADWKLRVAQAHLRPRDRALRHRARPT